MKKRPANGASTLTDVDMVSSPYDRTFFDELRDGARQSARVVAPLLLDLIPCRSVVDVGCGVGTWLSVFAEHGVADVFGVDGDYVDRSALEIAEDRFRALELEQPFLLDRQFDLVLSLEVAEHLPASCARGFVGSLTALGPVVLFSAAIPFQGGVNHRNEQWPGYWAALFAERGYAPIDCLRRKVWADQRVEWWYAQNMIMYAERTTLAERPRLAVEAGRLGSPPLAMVHPKRYVEWVEWALANSATSGQPRQP